MVMKKVLLVGAAATIAILTGSQAARASTIHVADIGANPITIESNAGTVDVIALDVTNINNPTVTLTQIEVWLGGEDITTPPTGYSYDLDATSAGNLSGGDVAPKNGSNPGDQITSAELVNNSSSGYCYVGESLIKGASCDIELVVTVTGVAPTGSTKPGDLSSSETNIYTTVTASSGSTSSHDYNVDIDEFAPTPEDSDVPEPRSLVLLGSGFGLLGLGVFLRKKYAAAHLKAN
jgi:hypothetical protein